MLLAPAWKASRRERPGRFLASRGVSGLLPPLYGVGKRIEGDQGETRIGTLPGIPFRVDGLTLKYHAPLGGFVDLLEREGDGYNAAPRFVGASTAGSASGASRLAKPGSEELLDLPAPARHLETSCNTAALKHEEGGDRRDAEALDEVRPLLRVDAIERERLVVLPPLEHLRDEALDPTAAPGRRREEIHEPGTLRPLANCLDCLGHVSDLRIVQGGVRALGGLPLWDTCPHVPTFREVLTKLAP